MYGTTVSLNPTYFIGMDLHSNNVVICVLQNAANQTGQLVKKVGGADKKLDFLSDTIIPSELHRT